MLPLLLGLAAGRARAGEQCGPVVLAGHDADDHGFERIYAGIYSVLLANVRNGNSGILAIGVEPFSEAGEWIVAVSELMTPPQTVTFAVGSNIATVSFDGFAIVHVPSTEHDTGGGLTDDENLHLAARRDDLAAFVNSGGGLFGLTQGGESLHRWEYLSAVVTTETLDVPSSGLLPSGNAFSDVSPTPMGLSLGITESNIDGCCFHNVFTTFPAFFDVLAVSVTPEDPDYDGQAVFIGGLENCLLPSCGDGNLDPIEQCDDGNTLDGDGCSAACEQEVAGGCAPTAACAPCTRCADAGSCHAAAPCESLVVVADPDGVGMALACDPPGPYAVGTTTVSIHGADADGNAVALACEVVVADCEPPACLAPPPLTLECGDVASDGAIAAWLAAATAADACPGSTIADVLAPTSWPGGCGAGAETRVAWIARDATGAERTCTATVRVQDTTPPLLVAPPALTIDCDAPGSVPSDDPRIAAWLASAVAQDACGMATLTHDAPAVFEAGCPPGVTTEVRFLATDACGLVTEAVSTVTVVDTTPPVIAVQPLACAGCNVLWPPSHGYADLRIADFGLEARDACGSGAAANAATLQFASCRSSQPEDARGVGDGTTLRDCVIGDGVLSLRAERNGGCPGGRTYAATITATDACGNVVESAPVMLCVWHDRSHPPQGSRVFFAEPRSNAQDERPGENGSYGDDPCGAGCPACGG